MMKLTSTLFLGLTALLFTQAEEATPKGDVVTVTGENFDEVVLKSKGLVLLEFYAPWCGHCKQLAPEWEKVATSLKAVKDVTIAATDATAHGDLAGKFDVNGYPTIVTFQFGDKEDDEGIIYEPYNGGRTADAIFDYVAGVLDSKGIDLTSIDEVLSQSSFDECLDTKYCILSILPHIIDTGASGRVAYIDTLKAVSKKLGRTNPSKFVWTEAGKHPELEAAFGSSSFPSVIAVNHKRSRYGSHIGQFSADAITKTIRALQSGRAGVSTYTTLPSIEEVEAWDGKDYVYPEEEDDY